jgi:hypothetical protein
MEKKFESLTSLEMLSIRGGADKPETSGSYMYIENEDGTFTKVWVPRKRPL